MKQKILVLDDDTDILEIINDFLSEYNYEVTPVTTTKEALKEFKKKHFDLIITDLKLKEKSGIDFIKDLKENFQIIPPIIIMTGYGSVETAIESLKMGVQDYILKPFKASYLLSTIEKALKNAELEKENLQLKEIIKLYIASEQINNSLKLYEVGRVFVKNLQEITNTHIVSLYLLNEFGILRKNINFFTTSKRYNNKRLDLYNLFPEKINFRTLKKEFLKDGEWNYFYSDKILEPLNIKVKYKNILMFLLKTGKNEIGLVFLLSMDKRLKFTEEKIKALKIIVDEASIALENAILFRKNQELFFKILNTLAVSIDAKDKYTHYHSTNVAKYAGIIASKIFSNENDIDTVIQGSLVHDIGKIGIPESILNKPGPLTSKEFEKIQEHPGTGRAILLPLKDQFKEIIDIVYFHHERYDGKGYPTGRGGEEIPLKVKIVSVADAFDAMTTDRSYRNAMDIKKAVSIIKEERGKQFDPTVVDAFLDSLPELKAQIKRKNIKEG